MSDEKPQSNSRIWRRLLRLGMRIFVAVILVFVVLIAALWMFRKPLAEAALSNYCADAGLECSSQVTQFSLSEFVLSDLKITSGEAVPLEAREIRADLIWTGFLSPAVAAIGVTDPVLRGAFDGETLSLYGLEALAGDDDASDAPPDRPTPEVTIGAARIFLQTPAGEVSATAQMDGNFPEDGRLMLSVDPAQLSNEDGQISWSEGAADIIATGGDLSGSARLVLGRATFNGFDVRDAQVDAAMIRPGRDSDDIDVTWDGTVGAMTFREMSVGEASLAGTARLNALPADMNAALASLQSASVKAFATDAAIARERAAALSLTANVEAADGGLSGPIELSLEGGGSRYGTFEDLRLTGQVTHGQDAATRFTGEVGFSGAALTDAIREQAAQAGAVPQVLSAHRAALQRAIRRAGQSLSGDVTLTASRASDGGFSAAVSEAAVMTSGSGLTFTATPEGQMPWMAVAGGAVQLNGRFGVSGGGGPTLAATLKDTRIGAGPLNVSLSSVRLSPWTEDGTTLAAQLPSLTVRAEDTGEDAPGRVAITARGWGTLSGQLLGLTLQSTRLDGGVTAIRTGTSWRAQPSGSECLNLNTDGFVFGAIAVQQVTTPICPEGGAFVRAGSQALAGGLRLGETLSVPFTTRSGGGTLTVTTPQVDWSARNGLSLSVLADDVSLPLSIGSRTLTIDGSTLKLGVITGQGAPKLSAQLGATDFGGSLIPANVSADAFRFDGTSAKAGISGALTGTSVRISDTRADPLYEPLITDLTGQLTDGQMTMIGDLRLQRGGLTLASTQTDLNIVALDGRVRVDSRPLVFNRGGLQPAMLSDRLRGVFTFASGVLRGDADIQISGGSLSGTGNVSLENFGFQTTRLGRVDGVNGALHFDDLLGLTSAPGQEVTVKAMSIGLPLEDGRIVFALEQGTQLAVESASFPFAGGDLALDPFDWTFGGAIQNIDVTASRLSIPQIVEVFKLPDLEATGTVSGRFPIVFDGTKVIANNALLKADPGGGSLAYTGAAAEGAQMDANSKLAFDALRDMSYSVLEIGLNGDLGDRVTASIRLSGKNNRSLALGERTEVLPGQPFEFGISVDTALGDLISNASSLTSQARVRELVGEAIERERQQTPAEQ